MVNFVLAFFLWIKFVLSSIKIIFFWNIGTMFFWTSTLWYLLKVQKPLKFLKGSFCLFLIETISGFFSIAGGGAKNVTRKIPSFACCFLLPLNPSHQSMWSFYLSDLDMVHRRENHAVHHSDIHQPRSIQSCSTSLWYTPT